MDEKMLFSEIGEDFEILRDFFAAIGNDTRQHIIMSLIAAGPSGIRVGDITVQTNLSRPAVSHHLKILKDAGVVHLREEGTKNYYYICIRDLIPVLDKAHEDLLVLADLLEE